MFAKLCFCLGNLWLWANTAASLPVNHALADFLNQNSDSNSLNHQNNNARFDSRRFPPRYKAFASNPWFDIRQRSPLKQTRERMSPLAATTPFTPLTFPFSIENHPAKLLPNVEASSPRIDSTTLYFSTSTVPTTLHVGEVLSMRVSTSVTNSHHPDDGEKLQVRESTTELNTESTMRPDNTVLDTQTTPVYNLDTSSPGTLGIIAYYNFDTRSDTTQQETTTSAELVNSNDLTLTRTMNYYSIEDIALGHGRTGKSSSNVEDAQPAESRAVTTRVPIDYLPTPEASYGKPEENYEISEEHNVRSNGRIHGVQTISSTSTQNTAEISDDAKAETDRRKSSYVVEGRNYKKYRVEEETSDGFIVGEYGVFSHNDGTMRGVRYTAESSINPRLIYHALLKFLSLQ